MLKYDPIPWLMRQEDEAAVRARCALGLAREGDDTIARKVVTRFANSQLPKGSFDRSPMKTACVVCLLADLAPELSADVMSRAGEFLFGLLAAQPGYRKADRMRPTPHKPHPHHTLVIQMLRNRQNHLRLLGPARAWVSRARCLRVVAGDMLHGYCRQEYNRFDVQINWCSVN